MSDITPRPAPRRFRALALAIAIAVALVSCTTAGNESDSSGPSPRKPSPSTPGEDTPTRRGSGPSEVIRSDVQLTAYEQPDSASPSRTLPPTTSFGSPTVLLGTDRTDGWIQVLVPGRPVGATLWLPIEGLDIETITSEIRVDLSDRSLALVENGEVILETPIAVGTADAPTPTGRFSVTDKLQSPEPDGAYGPFALGLSARSEVVTEFAGGDGQIGIHGTDDPTSIGQPASHGCLRVPNEVIAELNRRLPLGTPVVVEP